MLFRASGLLRLVSDILGILSHLAKYCAEGLEQLPINPDIDTCLWIALIVLILRREFKLLASLLALTYASLVFYHIVDNAAESVRGEGTA